VRYCSLEPKCRTLECCCNESQLGLVCRLLVCRLLELAKGSVNDTAHFRFCCGQGILVGIGLAIVGVVVVVVVVVIVVVIVVASLSLLGRIFW
jgi:hypothetical protein